MKQSSENKTIIDRIHDEIIEQPETFYRAEINDIVDIERSIIKRYRKELYSKFVKAIKAYELVSEGDKIAVCISGGKDSLLLAKLFQELQRHGDIKFELEFIAMDPGYIEANVNSLKYNCEKLEIPVHYFSSNIFEVTEKISKEYPCYLCARMRRGTLYNKAKELGCNKIALGHHYDDVIETTLLNLFYGSQFKTMVPKLSAENFEGMELIRPMYFIREKDIIRFKKYNGLKTLDCACAVAAEEIPSKRQEVRKLIEIYKTIYEDVDVSIFSAGHNVMLHGINGINTENEKLRFNDLYNKNLIIED